MRYKFKPGDKVLAEADLIADPTLQVIDIVHKGYLLRWIKCDDDPEMVGEISVWSRLTVHKECRLLTVFEVI